MYRYNGDMLSIVMWVPPSSGLFWWGWDNNMKMTILYKELFEEFKRRVECNHELIHDVDFVTGVEIFLLSQLVKETRHVT